MMVNPSLVFAERVLIEIESMEIGHGFARGNIQADPFRSEDLCGLSFYDPRTRKRCNALLNSYDRHTPTIHYGLNDAFDKLTGAGVGTDAVTFKNNDAGAAAKFIMKYFTDDVA